MKLCLECGSQLFGRVDKKFCNDSCRNGYNNRENAVTNNLVRKINRRLGKNRRILAELNPKGKSRTTRDILVGKGFEFNLFTTVYVNKKGGTYFFCYDQGYIELEDGTLALVLKHEDI